MTRVPLFGAVLGLALCGAAAAQSFNIDVGFNAPPFGLPSPSFGAAAGQAGTWNAISPAPAGAQALVDLSGAATPATIMRTIGSPQSFSYDNVFVSGDDQLLMEDAHDIGISPSGAVWTIAGLAPGSYTVYTYAWAPDNIAYVTTVNGTPVGGAWPGGYAAGVTHAVHTFQVAAGGSIVLTMGATSGYGTFNGLQIVGQATSATTYCSGDGSATACPCGNAGAAGNGCGSSVNPSGAHLSVTGTASVASDSLVLHGSGMPDTSPVLYFQGTLKVNGGNGNVFGDGLRCAGGTVIRLADKTNAGGASAYPQSGDAPISVQGMISAGNVRDYQAWYRNIAPFCTTDTFNLTNGVELTWGP
jgi:hypothetical protein